MPVTSFPAEFLELYRRAAQETITISLKSQRDAHRLRARLHALRVEMRKEGHRYLMIAEGVQISVEATSLVARPADHVFVNALQAAGIEINATQEPPDLDASEADTALSRLFPEGGEKT